MVAGALTAVAAARLGATLAGSPLGAGLLAACAPLLVAQAAHAGGDAAATAAALGGVSLALSGWPLAGGALAGLSLGIKPIAFPLLLALVLAPRRARAALGLALGALPFLGTLDPLLRPRPGAGILGSWWRTHGGAPPPASDWSGLLVEGVGRLLDMPTWTALHALLALGVLAALLRRSPLPWVAVALLALAAPSTLLGDQLRPRYLGPASALITVAAGAMLPGRRALLALAAAWPALAQVSALGAVRAREEGLPLRPVVPWPEGMDAKGAYLDHGVCGAGELRLLAAQLAGEAEHGARITVPRLRDGREGELVWPLLVARPDLQVQVLDGVGCADGACLGELRGEIVFIDADERCATRVVDPAELGLAAAMGARWGTGRGVYGRVTLAGSSLDLAPEVLRR